MLGGCVVYYVNAGSLTLAVCSRCTPGRCRPSGGFVVDHPAGSLSDVDDKFVTFSELCRDFEFIGNYSVMLEACALYPRGSSLPVEITDVVLFVEQFQFLTREHLHMLCVQHGISDSLTR